MITGASPPPVRPGETLDPAAVRWPPGRFFWAIVDPSRLGSAGRRASREQLGFLFERALPVPIEEVQCAFAALPDGRVVACGVRKRELDAAVASGELAHAVACGPSTIPEFIDTAIGAPLDTARLNVLHGAYEPRELGRWRRIARSGIAVGVALSLVALGIGFWQRDASARAAVDAIAARRDALIETALPATGEFAALPPQLRLTAELRRLEQTRGSPGSAADAAMIDASSSLAEVLRLWPKGGRATLDGITVTTDTIDVRGAAGDATEAERVAVALRGLAEWRVPQPQFRTTKDGVSFTLRLERVAGGAAEGAAGGADRSAAGGAAADSIDGADGRDARRRGGE